MLCHCRDALASWYQSAQSHPVGQPRAGQPAVQPFGAAFLSGDVAQCGHRGRPDDDDVSFYPTAAGYRPARHDSVVSGAADDALVKPPACA